MKNKNKIAVVDIETSGFVASKSNILEVAIVSLDLLSGKVKEEFHCVCHENLKEIKKDAWIFKNSNLSYKEVKESLPFNDYKEEIQHVLNMFPRGCTAFNKRFDFSFLKYRGINIKELPCLMKKATPIVKAKFKNKKGIKACNVQEAYDHFFLNTDYIETHRALDDALHEAKIAYELVKIKNDLKKRSIKDGQQ